MNRKDNTIGKSTIENCHTSPSTKGREHIFNSPIGDSYHLDIKICTTCDGTYDANEDVIISTDTGGYKEVAII